MDDLLYLVLIWVAVFMSQVSARLTRLTPVLFFLFFGALFVNLGVFPDETSEFIGGFAEIGIILIMFALGFEENTAKFVRSIKRSWGIAFFGGLVPFLVAYGVADYFWGDFRLSLITGLAMTATAVSLTMVSLKAEGLNRTDAATGIMTSAILDDIASLALLAALLPFITGAEAITVSGFAVTMAKAVGFFLVVAVIGLWIFPSSRESTRFGRLPILGRFGIRHLFDMSDGASGTLLLVIIAVSVGLIAEALGFHAAIGAYMAGLILKEEYFKRKDGSGTLHYQHAKGVIDNVAFVWIGPVFFVTLGARLHFDLDILISVIPEVVTMFLGLFIGQILSAGLAARFTGGFDAAQSVLIGFGMLGRAELAFLVIEIGYVHSNALTTEAFYTLMGVAFCLNVSVPLMIRLWKSRFSEPTRR